MAPDGWTRLIYDGDTLKACGRLTGAERIIVTFDYRRPLRSEFVLQSPSARLIEGGVDQIHVFAGANHWFITPETDALIQSLSPITQSYASVRTMGYSMGGYAAFRFARDLSAEAAIAVSPQATIDPSTVPFDRRYRREGKSFDARKGHLGQAASDSLEGLIAVDPFRGMDMVHARMILTHFPSVRLARLPFGGHPATKALAGVNRGVILQEIAMADRVAAESLVLAHRRSRIESIDYWKELGAWADRKRPALAEAAGVALSALRGRRAEMRRAAKSG